MDFTGRNSQPTPGAPRPGTSFSADNNEAPSFKSGGSNNTKKPNKDFDSVTKSKWGRTLAGAVIIAIALLCAAVLGVMLTTSDHRESNLVASEKYQAVFLTNDQVYFGKITEVNSKFLVLNKVYYLQTSGTGSQNQTTANSNVSLVKLGCELHKPYDQMVLNRDQVQFWENLQSDGQVGTAIKQFEQQNPSGQKCSTPTTSNSTNVQGSTDTTGNTNTTTDTSNTTTDKKSGQ